MIKIVDGLEEGVDWKRESRNRSKDQGDVNM